MTEPRLFTHDYVASYDRDPWVEPMLVAPVAPKRRLTTGMRWAAGILSLLAIAGVAAALTVTVGSTAPGPAAVYRTSATPDYRSFSSVFDQINNTPSFIAGSALDVSLSTTLATAICSRLQAGDSVDALVGRETTAGDMTSDHARLLIDAAHNLVCNGR